jgi:hypothetical protein
MLDPFLSGVYYLIDVYIIGLPESDNEVRSVGMT